MPPSSSFPSKSPGTGSSGRRIIQAASVTFLDQLTLSFGQLFIGLAFIYRGNAEDYGLLDKELYGEAILTLGGMIDYAKRDFYGIVLEMPFGCMPGTNADAISPMVKKIINDLTGKDIPVLNSVDDETKQPNRELQIQLLIEQARQRKAA